MRKEALIGLSVLLVAVSGSATVLDSFGVISGEASVDPALVIEEIHWDEDQSPNYEYVKFRNDANQDIDVSRILIGDEDSDEDSLSGSQEIESGQVAVITGNDVSSSEVDFGDIHLTTDDSGIADSGLNNNGETVYLKIDSVKVATENYSGDSG